MKEQSQIQKYMCRWEYIGVICVFAVKRGS